MATIFHPVEHAILCDYFEIPRPEDLKDIDITAPGEEGAIHVTPRYKELENDLGNAAARIALEAIQNRLPQFGCVSADGELSLGREIFDRSSRKVPLLPQFLFTINWADTAPGVSWPESYYATFIPEYDRIVVTASFDSPDMYGYTDIAIGWFEADKPIKDGVHDVLLQWWGYQYSSWDQARWAYVWGEGAISRELANAWADEIWAIQGEDDGGED